MHLHGWRAEKPEGRYAHDQHLLTRNPWFNQMGLHLCHGQDLNEETSGHVNESRETRVVSPVAIYMQDAIQPASFVFCSIRVKSREREHPARRAISQTITAQAVQMPVVALHIRW